MDLDDNITLAGLSVLVVDDEPSLRRRLMAHMKALHAEVTGAATLEEARHRLGTIEFDFLLLDVNLPDGLGFDLMRNDEIPSNTGVIIMTAEGGIEGAIEAMKLGALDYLTKPFDPAQLPLVMQRARQTRQSARIHEHEQSIEDEKGFFFGKALGPFRERIDKILQADARLQQHLPPILITGQTGSGKSTIARWIHRHGPRADRPMIEVNCSALPESLAESELFGSEKGAFTDSHATRQGLFEAAHGGTLFLDEIPSLSAAIQSKILLALEEGKIRRIGATREIEIDVRVIAATNQNLTEAVESGAFREDLLHRLDLLRLNLPTLHERGEDVVHLAERLLSQLCHRYRLPLRVITEEGKKNLMRYRWPGNVRELSHELERGLVFDEAASLDFAHLNRDKFSMSIQDGSDWLNPSFDLEEGNFVLEDAINRFVQLGMRQTGDNVSKTARLLGVTRDFVRYRLEGNRKEK